VCVVCVLHMCTRALCVTHIPAHHSPRAYSPLAHQSPHVCSHLTHRIAFPTHTHPKHPTTTLLPNVIPLFQPLPDLLLPLPLTLPRRLSRRGAEDFRRRLGRNIPYCRVRDTKGRRRRRRRRRAEDIRMLVFPENPRTDMPTVTCVLCL
jgi:hypothetical protein